MKVKDEAEWQKFLAEVASDPDPIAEPFREFLVAWADAAESVLDMWKEAAEPDEIWCHPVRALRDTLLITAEQLGKLSVGLYGQALVLYGTYWYYAGDDPDEFFMQMTTIEQALVADVMIAKALQLQASAETEEEKQMVSRLLYGREPDAHSH